MNWAALCKCLPPINTPDIEILNNLFVMCIMPRTMRQEVGLGLEKSKCLVDMIWYIVLYSYCRYGSICYVVGGRYLLVQFSAVFTMLTAECIVLPSSPSPSPHTTQPPLGTYHQNTFVTPSSPVKSDAASYCWLER